MPDPTARERARAALNTAYTGNVPSKLSPDALENLEQAIAFKVMEAYRSGQERMRQWCVNRVEKLTYTVSALCGMTGQVECINTLREIAALPLEDMPDA